MQLGKLTLSQQVWMNSMCDATLSCFCSSVRMCGTNFPFSSVPNILVKFLESSLYWCPTHLPLFRISFGNILAQFHKLLRPNLCKRSMDAQFILNILFQTIDTSLKVLSPYTVFHITYVTLWVFPKLQ